MGFRSKIRFFAVSAGGEESAGRRKTAVKLVSVKQEVNGKSGLGRIGLNSGRFV